MNPIQYLVKHPKMTAAVGVIAGAGSAMASYTPAYATSDLAPAIIDLITTVVVGVAKQGGTIGQVLVVCLVVALMTGVFASLGGLALTAWSLIGKFSPKK
jgi:hypothetical protein